MHTPGALAHLNDLMFDSKLTPEETLRLAQIYDLVLGLDLLNLQKEALVIRPIDASLKNEEIEALILEREGQRKKGDYAGALERLHAGMRGIDLPTQHFTDRVEQAQRLVGNPELTPAEVNTTKPGKLSVSAPRP